MSRAGLEKQGCREYFRRGLRKKGQRGRIKKFSGVVSFSQQILIQDFPGGPVVKTPCSQCRGPGLEPWSRN